MGAAREKVTLLRRICQGPRIALLPLEALKLYLLLLVDAAGIGTEHAIPVPTVQRALGRKISVARILDLGKTLEGDGLAAIRAAPGGPSSRRRARQPLRLYYRILRPDA
jgi:hypothetical protein